MSLIGVLINGVDFKDGISPAIKAVHNSKLKLEISGPVCGPNTQHYK